MIVVFWLMTLLFLGWTLRDRGRAREAVEVWLPEIRNQQWRPSSHPDPLAGIGPHELAYLSGGQGHAVNTAIVTLHRAGAVRISREGQVSAVADRAAPDDPLEQTVLRALADDPQRQQTAAQLRTALGASPAANDIHRRLVERGMLTPEVLLAPIKDRLRALLDLSISAIVVPWLLLALAALLPPGNWWLVVAAMAVSTVAGAVGVRTYLEGRRALASAGSHGGWRGEPIPDHRVAPLAEEAMSRRSGEILRMSVKRRALLPIGIAVALCGLTALDDPTIETALRPPEPQPAGDGGTGCGGCGGGCGGCGCGG